MEYELWEQRQRVLERIAAALETLASAVQPASKLPDGTVIKPYVMRGPAREARG